MNIFVLDYDPKKAAQYMCDKHVVKMITESVQMLSTAHHVLDGDDMPEYLKEILYKPTHVNHPCNVWLREDSAHYRWLYDHTRYLVNEYKSRYGKKHRAWHDYHRGSWLCEYPRNMASTRIIPLHFPIAMKQHPECIVEDNAVASYRNFYNQVKSKFAKWKNGNIPPWYNPVKE